ncbi:transketolase [Diaminobutyricibacter tongyongensis]|uniref:Transketolase n=1 Tax=Leifsonia tongyongensis TaxID=1268043 RepID=A0A6L9Y3H0_9MICO|nr:transketolase [Diaminobutyricibacter tongyongensis]NEN07784.1 transketolase [Diaminobutyricibacter tongyongensis]
MKTENPPLLIPDLQTIADLAAQLRVDSIRSTTSAGSGDPLPSMSAADLLAILISRHFRYDWDRATRTPDNDHLIFSKPGASPLLYAMYKAVGVISDNELVQDYRRFGSRLQAHPMPILPWVDFATGSPGQGLPEAVGIALAGKHLENLAYRVWVLCGESELTEGSVWEAMETASRYQLSNLITIVDASQASQRDSKGLDFDLETYAKRFEAFGAHVIRVNGHDLEEVDAALARACGGFESKPIVILAQTIKGRGSSLLELDDSQGNPLPPGTSRQAIRELGGERHLMVRGPKPTQRAASVIQDTELDDDAPALTYTSDAQISTQSAYQDALLDLAGRRANVVLLDAEVAHPTFDHKFAATFSKRSFELGFAEQQLVATATGLSVRNFIPFASTSAAFLTRAYDVIRMAGISGASIRLVGSHAGVEVGADGPSQMALEDIAMMRSINDATVLYPSDAVSTQALVEQMANRTGVSYLRTTLGGYPVLYEQGTAFPIGGSKVPLSSSNDHVTLVGAGVTLHECLAASKLLAEMGIRAMVIDAYSIRPFDGSTIRKAVDSTYGRIVVAEDHHPEGGLGEAVLTALTEGTKSKVRIEHLAVRDIPSSGTTRQLLSATGIDREAISQAAQRLVDGH